MTTFTDEEFIALWEKHGSIAKIAQQMGMSERSLHKRRRNIEARHGITLKSREPVVIQRHQGRVNLEIDSGIAIVFSDAHFWTTVPTTAYRALIKFIHELKPRLVVNNGDAFDGASISRHGRIGFLEDRPSVIQELNACKEMLQGIAKAAKGATLTWPLGNHDARFETFLAAQAPQYEFVHGFHLKDHFQEWLPCWATWVNGDTVIKHRWKGGIHATHNNTLGSGVNIVTGHLHSLKVTPYSDYTGTRYGIDTGTLADCNGAQFLNYTEDGPKNWRSGFAVLTFANGRLLPPEVVTVLDEDAGEVSFRGKIHIV